MRPATSSPRTAARCSSTEIAQLDLAVQPKLLRALENREVTPVGANAPIEIDVGIVCASHRELRTEVATRRFREDLYTGCRARSCGCRRCASAGSICRG